MEGDSFLLDYEDGRGLMDSIGGQFNDSRPFDQDVDLNSPTGDGAPDFVVDSWMDNDPPWNFGVQDPTVRSMAFYPPHGHNPLPPPSAFNDWRSNPGIPSEADTVPHDSGYCGSRALNLETFSSCSREYGNASVSGVDNIFNLSLTGPAGEAPETLQYTTQAPQSDQRGVEQVTSSSPWFCSICNDTLKSKSEFNKHKQRHDKPHRCTHADCPKSTDGFASQGDLVRHRKTVHKEYNLGTPTFRCPHDGCATKDTKIWPRADNFRSHLDRVHKIYVNRDDDLSQYHANSVSPPIAQPEESLDQPTSSSRYGVSHGPHSVPETPMLSGMATHFAPPTGMPTDDELLQSPPPPPITASQGFQPAGYPASGYHTIGASPKTPISRSRVDMLEIPQTTWRPIKKCDSESPRIPASSTSSLPSQIASSPITRPQPIQAKTELSLPTKENKDHGDYEAILSTIPGDILDAFLEKKAKSAERSRESSSTPSKSDTTCPTCKKNFDMPCKLRKHMKRHDKPYGCTRPLCDKTFGSKNDWKRHESSQHGQPEVWWCDLGCREFFQSRDEFKSHLSNNHGISCATTIDTRAAKGQLHGHFWCGFCCTAVNGESLRPRSPAGTYTDPRFDHIDDHYMGRNNLPRQVTSNWKNAQSSPSHRAVVKRSVSPPSLKRKGSSNLQSPRPKHSGGNYQK